MSELSTDFFFLSPVEAVKVTPKNLKAVAEWCGGKVDKKKSERVPGRVDSFVVVPTPRGAAISMAFPGMFVTKRLAVNENDDLKATFSVMRRDYFAKNYFETPAAASDATWERQVRDQQVAEALKVGLENGKIVVNVHGSGGDMKAMMSEVISSLQMVAGEDTDIVVQTEPEDDNTTPGNMVMQREDARASAVEEESLAEIPKATGNVLTPFEAGNPDRP